MTRLALAADLDRCTGCCSCVVACKEEHDLAPGSAYMRVVQIGPTGEFPDLSMYFLPVSCQQCGHPSCAEACPELAIGRVDEGFVAIDPGRCTGCGECVGACPYGAVVVDPRTCLAGKCDLCADRLVAGRRPVCVDACPGKALAVVEVDEATAKGAAVDEAIHRLEPDAGTEPGGRYRLTRQEWRDLC